MPGELGGRTPRAADRGRGAALPAVQDQPGSVRRDIKKGPFQVPKNMIRYKKRGSGGKPALPCSFP